MNTILGLYLGKCKSVACVYEVGSNNSRFVTVATDPEAIRKLLEGEKPDLVVFETCTVAGWVADLCGELKRESRVGFKRGHSGVYKCKNQNVPFYPISGRPRC